MKALRAVDNYFIGRGEGDVFDRLWTYGQYIVYLGIVAIVFI